MSFKFVLSQAGYDYNTSDPRNLILSSDYNTYKFHAQAATTVDIANGDSFGTTTINHSLGYAPSVIAYFEGATGKYFIVGTPVISGLSTYGCFLYASTSQLLFYCNRAGTSGAVSIDVYYYIMKEVGA